MKRYLSLMAILLSVFLLSGVQPSAVAAQSGGPVADAPALTKPVDVLSPMMDDTFLLGTWVNVTTKGGVPAIVITRNKAGDLFARAYGSCTPSWCNWGIVPATSYGTTVSSRVSSSFKADFRFSFKTATITGVRVNAIPGSKIMLVNVFSKFNSPSTRSNYLLTDYFVKVK